MPGDQRGREHRENLHRYVRVRVGTAESVGAGGAESAKGVEAREM